MCGLKERALNRHIPKQVKPVGADKTCVKRIKLFLLLFKFCGLFANKVTASGVKRCSWPAYGICVFWISFLALNICNMITYFAALEHIPFKSTINFVKHLLGCLSLTVDVITAYSSQNNFNKFFDRLDSYDHKAARIQNKRRDNLRTPWIVALLITFVNALLVIAIICTKMVDVAFLALLSDVYTMIIHMYGFLQKFLLLYLVFERFKHLNKNIAPNVSWDEEPYIRKASTIKISDVKIMHSLLYDAHEAFNDIYRNSLLLSFMFLMMSIFGNLSIFRQEKAWIATSVVIPPMMLILIICIICHRTAEEVYKANNIACILNKSMTMFVNSGKTMTKITTLTYFLHNCVSFDAAGFFTIDLPLFQSIVAAITTYFIILV